MEQFQAQELERVVRLERMMTRAYDIAMGKIQDEDLVEVLAPFREHHERNAQALQEQVERAQGGATQLEPTFSQYLEEVLETIEDAVRRDEALGELRIAEAALMAAYGQAVEFAEDEVAGVLKECMSAEREHVHVLQLAHDTSKT